MAAALLAFGSAAEGQTRRRDEDLFARPEDLRTVLFGSIDAGRSVFVSGGSKQALTGSLDRAGLVLQEQSGLGVTRERFRSGEVSRPVVRFTHETSVMPGYQWNGDGIHVTALAGPELHQEQLTYDGQPRRVSQPRLGGRGQVDLWLHPSPDTLVTGTAVATTARASFWGRASAGYRLWAGVFAGPEFTLYATPTYRERRWGAHLTGLALSLLTLRISGGWQEDDTGRRGSPYVGLSAWLKL